MAPSMLGGHDAPNRTTRTAPWSELVNCLSPVFAAWDGAVSPGETAAVGSFSQGREKSMQLGSTMSSNVT